MFGGFNFDVTVDYVQDVFAIQYSDNGSNIRTKEEAIVFHWFEYISNSRGIVQDVQFVQRTFALKVVF